jgi:hypothetical protein
MYIMYTVYRSTIISYNKKIKYNIKIKKKNNDEDKLVYTGCIEMMKKDRGASFTWPHLRAAVAKVAKIIDPRFPVKVLWLYPTLRNTYSYRVRSTLYI